MDLTEAKLLADKISKAKGFTSYTVADMREAVLLLERTSRGSKTQNAWDRLDRRLKALRAEIARRQSVAA